MKLLVIGIDGVCNETFERGWTPFIQSLLDSGDKLNLSEDLISRGWSEIVTGKHAIETGALYEGPKANGALDWTEAFKIDDIPGLGQTVKPLWQVLNERGYRVGFMNVPTTFPAPEVDGFFVSGGGGGGPISQDPVPDQCHPKGLAENLKKMGYIVDERRPSLLFEKGLYAPKDFFGRLKEMNDKRTQSFLELSKEYKIDFGFVVYRSTVTTETMLPPEIEKSLTGVGEANREFIQQAKLFYQHFDGKIKRLIEEFPEAEVIIVSDHSMAINRYEVNANQFLVEIGYQENNPRRRGMLDVVKSYKHLIPYSLKEKIKKNKSVKNAYQSMVPFDPKRTKAFSQSFSSGQHGIYVNDVSRFGGPVKETDIGKIASDIVFKFNAHPVAAEHGMRARLKPESNSAIAYRYPDVVLDNPDGFYTTNQVKSFVVKTDLPHAALDLYDVKKNRRSVVKGHTPLVVNVKNQWGRVEEEANDLTLVYKYIVSKLGEIS